MRHRTVVQSYTDNWKSNNLILGEGPTSGINDSTGEAEEKLVLASVKQIQKFTKVYSTIVMWVTCT